MVDGKKIIGVCMTKMQDGPRSRTIAYLHEEAEKLGYKLMIFNSAYDFYNGLDEEIGAAKLYEFINYSFIDALIILCSGFMDKTVCRVVAKNALEHGVPVILEDDEAEGCYTVRNSFEKSLTELMNHVIHDHGRTDTFFLAGPKDNEYSDKRIDVYKQVLQENGLSFDDSMIDYGDFWEMPARAAMGRLLARDKKLPQVIFCANDAMAITASKVLIENGIRVPEDVVVTGFDGSMMAEFYRPQISTCVVNHSGFAKICLRVIQQQFNGLESEKINYNLYTVRLAESCGCPPIAESNFRKMAELYHRQSTNMIGHEDVTYNKILVLLNSGNMDLNTFYGAIAKIMGQNSVMALRLSFLTTAIAEDNDENLTDEDLVMISSTNEYANSATNGMKFSSKDMIPDMYSWVKDEHSAYVINSVQIGKNICGYYEAKTDDILKDAHMINRVHYLANMIIHIAASDMRQRFLKIKRSEDTLIDPLTELPNLHSLTKWFEQFSQDNTNQNKHVALSVYQMPKYRIIYEKYGIEAVETAMCYVAEAIRIANPQDCFLANTAENEFIVVNYGDDKAKIDVAIQQANALFCSIMDSYNLANENDYFVEISSGCTMVDLKAGQNLDYWMRQAVDEIILNRQKYGTMPVGKEDIATSKEQYDRFNTLITKNLFLYHFQPIVSAKTGDIIAYEALMRTDQTIGYNPLEVLSIAKDYHRLYDVEKATLFNVMQRYVDDREFFCDRKVFINCIPGNFLNNEDNARLSSMYSEHIKRFVFEIIEQDTITEEELHKIRNIGNDNGNNMIAVDDYGTGHSNLVNLLTYAPEIVKIDRFLITDISEDQNKQMLVRGVIDFAKVNNIKVLAEGVETREELDKVIEMGVDYIQGYYTGRPAKDPLDEINPEIKGIIQAANRKTQ